MTKNTFPLFGLLENIRSLHNVGSVFRTSDGAGVDLLFLTGYTCPPPRDQISKTALGAEEVVPWKHYKRPMNVVRRLKNQGVTIVALEKNEDSTSIYDFVPGGPVCLMVGNEVEGLSDQLLAEADHVFHLPMLGKKESLNVACAYSAAMYVMRGMPA
jgi:tRNA G18 (ribose-2'-O)-methylase SpoU